MNLASTLPVLQIIGKLQVGVRTYIATGGTNLQVVILEKALVPDQNVLQRHEVCEAPGRAPRELVV